MVHCNQSNNTLQLQVDVFCLELAEGTLQFMTDISGDTDAMQRMDQLLLIRDVNGKPLLGGA
ncbi:MAG: hypothetical protein SGJ26_09040 [Nitrospirota bacterium]|nr:hypothetical protein [Nitrospirota bacterium]